MSYCRKCAAKLDEDARFCHVCGTPVAAVTAATRLTEPKRRRPFYILPVAILIAVLLSAIVIGGLFFLPFYPIHFNQTNQIPKTNMNNLFLEFQTDIAQVNIFFENLSGNMAMLNVTADGNVGIFDDPNRAVNVTFSHHSMNNSAIVIANVFRATRWAMLYNLNVNCDVYIDPSANLTLHIRSSVGNIVIDADAEANLLILDLQTVTGSVDCSLSKGVIITGNVSLLTTTGNLQFRMDEENVIGNATVNLQSTTGSVNVDLTTTQRLSGNVIVNAQTTTGSVNLRTVIDDDVGARIESHTVVGGINVDVEKFSGNQTSLQSDNYPAGSNFLVYLRTTTGGININATYGSSTVLS